MIRARNILVPPEAFIVNAGSELPLAGSYENHKGDTHNKRQ